MTQWRQAPATQREAAPEKRLPLSLGYLIEEEPGVFRLTADRGEATHQWGPDATEPDDAVAAVALGEPTGDVRTIVQGRRMILYRS